MWARKIIAGIFSASRNKVYLSGLHRTCNFVGLQSAMEALPEALLLEKQASFMDDLSKEHLWAYLPQPFRPVWQFLQLQVQWSHDKHHLFRQRYTERAPCYQPDPACGSATPTSTVHAFFRCTRWLSTFHRGAWPVFTYKTELERKRTRFLLQRSFFFKRKNERERASMTGESSRARFGRLCFIAERNLPS